MKNSLPFLCLFEPEIHLNVGSIIRLSACFSNKLVIIRPIGFIWDVSKLSRSAMDYIEKIDIVFFDSFQEFKKQHEGRIVAAGVGKGVSYSEFDFMPGDAILMGKESVGLPESVYDQVDGVVNIPIKARSLNLAMASAILISKACL